MGSEIGFLLPGFGLAVTPPPVLMHGTEIIVIKEAASIEFGRGFFDNNYCTGEIT